MPLVGTICCQDGLPTSFETCWERCRKRECVFPLPLLDAMKGNGDRRVNAGLSATTLLQCPRQTILKREFDYYESPGEYHARWRGEGVHAMAEHYGPYTGIVQETRIRKSIAVGDVEVEITGQPDWWDRTNYHLDDWKSTGSCPASPYDDHIAQVNIYAWLIDGGIWETGERSEDIVQSASIVYIDPKRSVIRDIELWSNDATEAMILRKVTPIVENQQDGTMPIGIEIKAKDAWKHRFCVFRGTGKCCADT